MLLYPVVATVTVEGLSMTVSPSNITVCNGTELLLNCVAMGDTDGITYNWYKDDTLINYHRVSIYDNGSLLINATDYRHDDGIYHCEATDRHGNNVTSNNSATLQIACELPW